MLSLDPKHADAYNYLGYMFADEGVKLEEAVTLIRKALEMEPENGAFIDSLGWADFKLGRLDDALTELLRAVKYSRREDPTIREHLGDVYFRKGMLHEALREWDRALTIDETNATLRKDDDPEKITPERGYELLADKRARGPVKKTARRAVKKTTPRKTAAKKTTKAAPRATKKA